MSEQISKDAGMKASQIATDKESSKDISEKNECSMVPVAKGSSTQPNDSPAYPKFSSKSARIASFEHWPVHKCQKGIDMAEAGFFYTGKEDRTLCHYCGGGLKDWEEGDDPWEQHDYWYGSVCDYIRLNNKTL